MKMVVSEYLKEQKMSFLLKVLAIAGVVFLLMFWFKI